jgi:hypothetical protein
MACHGVCGSIPAMLANPLTIPMLSWYEDVLGDAIGFIFVVVVN